MKKVVLSVAALMMLMGSVNAATIGYAESSKTPSSTNAFLLSKSTIQGQAIRLSKEKLQALKGKTISSVSIRVGSNQTNAKNIHAFVSTSLDGTALAEGDVYVSRAFKEVKFTLPQAYTITGDEDELYIGYRATMTSTTSTILVADNTCDLKGCNYAIKDGEWVDTYGTNKGSAYISAEVDGVGDYVDAIVGKSDIDGYYKAEGSYDYTVKIKNIGTTAITSFDAVGSVGGKSFTQKITGVNIAPKAEYAFNLTDISSGKEGTQDLDMKIENINGGAADIDESDNTLQSSIFFYPSNMERGILVEQFTGQDCPNCPAGHRAVASAIETAKNYVSDKIYSVAHHAGYYPDIFTTSEDADATIFYGQGGSGAPAIMVNRLVDGVINTTSPVTYNCQTVAVPLALISAASEIKPYASLNLETTLDKATRKLNVKLQVKPHITMPDNMLFQVYLIQDGLVAYQSNGGDSYTHDHVLRCALTGNDSGVILKAEPGKTVTWETEYDIPENIHSSYYTDNMLRVTDEGKQVYYYSMGAYSGTVDAEATNIKAVLDNMQVVAFIGEYDYSNLLHNTIYNCVGAKLGESYKQAAFGETLGIETVNESKNDAKVYVSDGKIMVDGKYDKMQVYSLSGAQVSTDSALGKGVYIVKVVSGGKQTSKKVLVK